MSRSEPASELPRRHRARDLLIEVGVVVVLGVHLVAFLAIRASQHRYADEARDIAAWAEEHDVSRIAWPADLRSSVPVLLEAGITPVLVDPSEVNAQQLVVNDTPVLVARALPADLVDLATARHRSGDLDVALVDLDAAQPVPLGEGQAVEIEYSRPYLYAPIRDSHQLAVDAGLVIPMTLGPGEYQLTTEAYDPEASLDLVLSAVVGDTPHVWVYPLEERVFEAQVLSFGVVGSAAEEVVIRIEVVPRAGSDLSVEGGDTAVLHRWSIERVG